MSTPKIILYTNRGCPWAHRAHIALKESGLDYEEVTIDLNKPREPWYLDVNPHLLQWKHHHRIRHRSPIHCRRPPIPPPTPSGPAENALYRARVAFFVDAFFSKVVPHLFASLRAASDAERDDAAGLLVDAVVKEVEPLLEDGKGPFFGGSERLTLAEVQSGSFLLRILGFAKPEHGLVSAKLPALLERAPRFKRWAEATVAHESVNFIWEEKAVADKMRAKFAPKV
ncbi:hypothetical protein N7444_010897 [Penicillium canescens]|nr:hypothetical protein N7444_010897 [Penicillium canescens]